VPLTYTTQEKPDFNATQPQLWLENVRSTVVEDLPGSTSWILFNVHETGLFFLFSVLSSAEVLENEMCIKVYLKVGADQILLT
jgi:hypothetical protein